MAVDPGRAGGTSSVGVPVAARSDRSGRGSHHVRSFVKELVFVVVGALIVSSLLRAFIGQMFIIPSESMESTLLKGDRVVVQKVAGFHRGDVVVFQDPGGWLPDEPVEEPGPFDRVLEFVGVPTASTPGHLIKRVIGLPGDKVVCCVGQGRLTVNGYPLDETAHLYVNPDGTRVAPSDVRFAVTVPVDRIFVMGDHRDLSKDSRCHLSDAWPEMPRGGIAFVPEKPVVGPAFGILAPFDRVQRLRTSATFAGDPDPTEPAPTRASIEPAGVSW